MGIHSCSAGLLQQQTGIRHGKTQTVYGTTARQEKKQTLSAEQWGVIGVKLHISATESHGSRMNRCKAKGCTNRFEATRPFQSWCGPECGLKIAQERQAKSKAKQAKEERKKDKAKRESLKRRADWLKDAERAVNAYVQRRDRGLPCVSCGCALQDIGHASHYRSVGSSPALRFDLANIHRSCVKCNLHLHGNLIPYRVELVKRIGLAEVERLEGPQPIVKHSIEDLKQIIQTYRAKWRELEKT